MLYDEIIKIVTLAGELMLQAQDEELTVFDKEGTDNISKNHLSISPFTACLPDVII